MYLAIDAQEYLPKKSYLMNNVMEMAFDTTRKLSLPWPDAAAGGIL